MAAAVTGWRFADAYEAIAERAPERPCLIQGERVLTWAEVDRRADALAADLLAAGLGEQAKVAAYLYNGPEYLETYIAAFKAGLVPVNTNYRYGPEEIVYLFDNADAEAVVFHASFTDLLDGVRHRLSQGPPLVRRRRRQRRRAGVGHAVRRGGGATGTGRRWRPGGAAATTCCSSTPVVPRACPRA